MKLGFIQAYNEVNWIGYAIDQAMMLCDEVLVMEGAQYTSFHDIPERSDDGTLDIISDKMTVYPSRIKMAKSTRVHKNYRINQCDNFNYGLGLCKPGDYFLILDADEFHSDYWVKEANELMRENKVEAIKIVYTFFAFSFKWLIDYGPVGEISVVLKKTNGLRFAPTSKRLNVGKRVKRIGDKSNHFHYSWVKPEARMLTRMRTSKRFPTMLTWFLANWRSIKLEEGATYQSYNREFTLHRYDGKHPSVLDSHPWLNVEDVRRLGI